MRLRLAALTRNGLERARAVKAAFPGAELWVGERQRAAAPEAQGVFPKVADFAALGWDACDGLVFFLSLGAVVRTIAPLLRSKETDPAVVCVDDAGRFAVSVLSGHVGGANDLALRVAEILGAQAVVTTASDALGTVAVDILGRELGWRVEDKGAVTAASAAVVNGLPVAVVQECGESLWWKGPGPLPGNLKVFASLSEAREAGDFEAWLLVSDRATKELKAELGGRWQRTVLYRPRTLCLGMGCDAGADPEEAHGLALQGLAEAGLSPDCVAVLASIDLKAGEEALLETARRLGAETRFFDRDQLNAAGVVSPANPMVEKYTGAVGVCEPAAMLAAGTTTLLLTKRKSRRATLAVARREFPTGA